MLPSGTVGLVINLKDDRFVICDPVDSSGCSRYSGALVSGSYHECFVIETRAHAAILGVHFRPGGRRFF